MNIDKENLKCPFCEKDINFKWAEKEIEISGSENNPIFYRLLQCKQCEEIIIFLFEGLTEEKKEEIQYQITASAMYTSTVSRTKSKPISSELSKLADKVSELIFQYPFRKTTFGITGIPDKVKESLREAEKCFSFGAKNGAAACLRKCIYAICDDQKVEGKEYDEKIEKLFSNNVEFSTLTKQIKWLGDKHCHNVNEEKYTFKEIEKATNIIPLIIRKIYGEKELIKDALNSLNQSFQKTKSK
ncbi:MAG: DUF4145 domain-containing protein [bacterium]|nr:DUF4145 domain-containing protein [bacterium]